MFPFFRLFAPFRHYAIGFVFLTLIGYQASQMMAPPITPVQTNDPRLADVVAYEDLLYQKADLVLTRSRAESYTIDLSVTLDHTRITTTTFDPATSTRNSAAKIESPTAVAGTWQEETTTTPRVRNIKVCVTLKKDNTIDQDQLFRSLSYAMGIDLSRGDMLRLVFE